jgi:uncharacterized protein (DUF1800 family)
LLRAGFGGTHEQILALRQMGPEAAVDHLVDYESQPVGEAPDFEADPDLIKPPTLDQRRLRRMARRENNEAVLREIQKRVQQSRRTDRQQFQKMRQWWLQRMIDTPRPLEEKLTLFWHGHFATRYRNCRDSYLMYQQNQMFRKLGSKSFAKLARGIIRDPAMLVFLNNDRNVKRKPNENLARELMELFTIGEGQYAEQDIHEGARALTGYTRHDNDFVFRQRVHDTATKRLFGQKGSFDGDDFVNILLTRRACSEFICYKLYRFFVSDLPGGVTPQAKQFILALAKHMRKKKYALKPVLKKLFLSQHFYDEANVAGRIRSPVELTVGTIRALNTPRRRIGILLRALQLMGQELFNPPNVAGWPGGRMWINTATLYVRQNVPMYLLTGRHPMHGGGRGRDGYDVAALMKGMGDATAQAAVDHLLNLLVAAEVQPQRRQQLIDFAKKRGGVRKETLTDLLCLITAMPEYQVC